MYLIIKTSSSKHHKVRKKATTTCHHGQGGRWWLFSPETTGSQSKNARKNTSHINSVSKDSTTREGDKEEEGLPGKKRTAGRELLWWSPVQGKPRRGLPVKVPSAANTRREIEWCEGYSGEDFRCSKSPEQQLRWSAKGCRLKDANAGWKIGKKASRSRRLGLLIFSKKLRPYELYTSVQFMKFKFFKYLHTSPSSSSNYLFSTPYIFYFIYLVTSIQNHYNLSFQLRSF